MSKPHCTEVHNTVARGGTSDIMVATDLSCRLYEHDISYCKRDTYPSTAKQIEPPNDHGDDTATNYGIIAGIIGFPNTGQPVVNADIHEQEHLLEPDGDEQGDNHTHGNSDSLPNSSIGNAHSKNGPDHVTSLNLIPNVSEIRTGTPQMSNMVDYNTNQDESANPNETRPKIIFETHNIGSQHNHNQVIINIAQLDDARLDTELHSNLNGNNNIKATINNKQAIQTTDLEDLGDARFTDISSIGEGSFGRVYKAQHVADDNVYAIKVSKHITESSLINTEVDTLRQLTSDYVVEFIKHWVHNGRTFIQMKYYPYNLAQIIVVIEDTFGPNSLLPNHPLVRPVRRYIGCELFIEMARGLHYLHTRHPPIIHRDLKPTNVVFDPNPVLTLSSPGGVFCKLCDFGSATQCGPTGQSTVIDKPFIGTERYRAPDADSGRYKRKSDLHSLGHIVPDLMDIDW
ncbi:unnamed protein product [Medioppia subpectinata]|uniref:Protein kinase domain-containing protein n=1 Tax=Medioppia subpectinata TaxID=1979941 RepID=A0A7R9KEG2_9ACAR|nr:unnamed protein product [Medioppia subpectinata]CAG2100819.1 unnamed protein product [Medioppia subpectinata]